MARNIGATLSLNNGNFFTNMKSAINESNKLRNTLNGTTGGMKGFSTQATGTGNVLTSLASKAAVAVGAFVSIRSAVNFGRDVVSTGVEFEQGMANVSAISGATGAELTALSDKAKEMGATTKFSALEASDAMSYMAMAGWNSGQMIDGIGGIMNLAAASGEDLASVSDIVTDSLTAFGLTAADSAEFADILAVASSKSNTNVSMLGESFKNVAPTAGAMGYSVRDTTVALGLMANAGIKGGAAGTALNGVMTRLAKPTKDVTTALTDLNIEVTAADGSMKPLSQLIPELQSKFAGLTESEKGQYATMIAGKNAMSGFLSIVNSSPADFEALSAAIYDSEGAAQEMADTMNDTVSGKLTLLKSQFESVKLAIFDALGSSQFKGVLQSMSDGLAAIIPYVTTVTVAIGNGLFSAIQTIYNIGITVFNTVKTAIENNQPAIERVKSAFDNVKDSIVNAFSGNGSGLIQTLANVILPSVCNALSLVMNIAAGAITVISALSPVIAGIAGAVTAYKIAVTAANIVEGIRNGLIAFSAVMTGTQAAAFAPLTTATIAQIAATSALNVVTSAFGAIMTFVTSPIGMVVVAIGAAIAIGVALYKHWDQIKELAGKVGETIKNVFGKIKDVVSGAWNAVKEKTAAVWGAAKDTVTEKLNNIKTAYHEHGGGLKGIVAGSMEAVKGYYTAGYTFIDKLTGGKLSEVAGKVKEKLSPMVGTVKEKLSGVKDAFSSGFSKAFDLVKNSYNEGSLKPVVDKVVNTFSNVKNAIAEKFTGIKEAIQGKLTAIGDAVSGIKETIAEKFTSIKGAIADKFTAVKDAVVNILSPLGEAVTSVIGGVRDSILAVVDGIRTFITSSIENVRTTISNIVEGIRQNILTFFQNIQTAFEGVRSGISTVIDGIRTVITGVFQFIVGIFTVNIETIKTGVQTVKDGITTAVEGVRTIITNIINAVVSAFQTAFNIVQTVVGDVVMGIRTQFENFRTTASSVINSVWATISSTFENMKTKVSTVFENVKSTIRGAIDTIKGYFNFSWELPKIKLPHFKINGSFSLNPPSVPTLGIDWYKQGGIMTRPTMFGMNGNNIMAGGEAGPEAILPLSQFWNHLYKALGSKSETKDKNEINVQVDVHIDGNTEKPDDIAHHIINALVPELKLALSNL